jgi:hypothetical protein
MLRDLEEIAEDRFSPRAGRAFTRLRRLTRYHEFEKRDGGFLQRAIAPDGRILAGDELCRMVMQHYSTVHNAVPDNPLVTFPRLHITQEHIIEMMGNVNSGKGIAYDGITDKLFQVGGRCCRGRHEPCKECRIKINFAAELMTQEYWTRQESRLHLKGRLVAFNKKHPRMP